MKLTFCSPGDLAWIAKFRILSSIPRFIPNSAFYPQFRVLSPIPVPYSGSAFRFRIPVPRFILTPNVAPRTVVIRDKFDWYINQLSVESDNFSLEYF